MRKLTVPISEEVVRELTVGEPVELSGIIATGRDTAHKYIIENFVNSGGNPPQSEQNIYEELKKILTGGVIYHCGPVVQKTGETWSFVAAGPTTSIREEPYQAGVMQHFGLRAVIGKGGMGEKTLQSCQDVGAVYLHAIGGAATPDRAKRQRGIDGLQNGIRRAGSVLDHTCRRFPCCRHDGQPRQQPTQTDYGAVVRQTGRVDRLKSGHSIDITVSMQSI